MGEELSHSQSAKKVCCLCRVSNTVQQAETMKNQILPTVSGIPAFLKMYFTASVSTTKQKSLRDPFFRIPLFASSKHLRAVFIPTTVYCCANTIIFSLYKQREILIHPVCYYTCWAEGCSESHDSPQCSKWNSGF